MPDWLAQVLGFWVSEGHLWFTDAVVRPLATYLAIPAALASFVTWYVITIGRGWRQRRAARRALLRSAGSKPAAVLIVNLTVSDVGPQVEGYLKRNPPPASVPPELVFSVRRAQDLGPGDIANLVLELRDTINSMTQLGVRHVHLFYAGPVAFAAIVGCELKHPFTVTVYQNSRIAQDYECWGVLRLPAA
jgi:hypothetical protein